DVGGVGRAGDVDLQAGPARQGDGLAGEGQHLIALRATDVEGRRIGPRSQTHVRRVDGPEDVAARAGGQRIIEGYAGGSRIPRIRDRDGEADRRAGRDGPLVGRLDNGQARRPARDDHGLVGGAAADGAVVAVAVVGGYPVVGAGGHGDVAGGGGHAAH